MGPLVTANTATSCAAYVERGKAEGADLVLDGRAVTVPGHDSGFFLGPCLFDRVTPEMAIYTDEIFGPVLGIVRATTYDEALALVNASPYTNGVAVFTNDGGAARRFQNEVQVGMVGIDVPIPVPIAYTRSAAGSSHFSATRTSTAAKASTSTLAARSSPAAGQIRGTEA